jgi:hypothetical protein
MVYGFGLMVVGVRFQVSRQDIRLRISDFGLRNG